MIVDIFYNIFNVLMSGLFFILPHWGLPDFIYAGVVFVGPIWIMIFQAIPFLKSIFLSLTFILFFHLSISVFNISTGIIALIRGSGQPKV